jgi:hypothetical protein
MVRDTAIGAPAFSHARREVVYWMALPCAPRHLFALMASCTLHGFMVGGG